MSAPPAHLAKHLEVEHRQAPSNVCTKTATTLHHFHQMFRV